MTIILGTRGSRLALAQTELANQALEQLADRPKVEVRIINTTGDQRLDISLSRPSPKIDRALFTKELDESLPLFISNLEELLPAVGQGAIGLQVRSNDLELKQLLVHVNDPETWFCVKAERALLRMLGGGCQSPLGVRTRMQKENFWMEAI